MPSYAEWVATLALGLSGGSLGWQVVRARREQPVIAVEGQWSIAWEPDLPLESKGLWSLPVHVTNAGGRAVTVLDVYWEVQGDLGPFVVRSADMGPLLPTRLESLTGCVPFPW